MTVKFNSAIENKTGVFFVFWWIGNWQKTTITTKQCIWSRFVDQIEETNDHSALICWSDLLRFIAATGPAWFKAGHTRLSPHRFGVRWHCNRTNGEANGLSSGQLNRSNLISDRSSSSTQTLGTTHQRVMFSELLWRTPSAAGAVDICAAVCVLSSGINKQISLLCVALHRETFEFGHKGNQISFVFTHLHKALGRIQGFPFKWRRVFHCPATWKGKDFAHKSAKHGVSLSFFGGRGDMPQTPDLPQLWWLRNPKGMRESGDLNSFTARNVKGPRHSLPLSAVFLSVDHTNFRGLDESFPNGEMSVLREYVICCDQKPTPCDQDS